MSSSPHFQADLALLGAGGHAGVVLRLLDACLSALPDGWRMGAPARGPFSRLLIVGAGPDFVDEARRVLSAHLTDDAQALALSDDNALRSLAGARRIAVANGVGRRPTRVVEAGRDVWSGGRADFLDGYEADPSRFVFPALVHPSAVSLDRMTWQAEGWRALAGPGRIAPGAQIHAGCVVGARTIVEAHAIVNTRASLDHDCEIGARAFIGPGATLCGGVVVEAGGFVGAGATILPGRRIGAGAVAPAGATIRRDVPAGRIAAR